VDFHLGGNFDSHCRDYCVLHPIRFSRDSDVSDRRGEGVCGLSTQVPGLQGRERGWRGQSCAGRQLPVEVCEVGVLGLANMDKHLGVLGASPCFELLRID